jgi:hypothetical protein
LTEPQREKHTFKRSTASTANRAKWSFSTFSSFEESVVRAMFIKSSSNA